MYSEQKVFAITDLKALNGLIPSIFDNLMLKLQTTVFSIIKASLCTQNHFLISRKTSFICDVNFYCKIRPFCAQ